MRAKIFSLLSRIKTKLSGKGLGRIPYASRWYDRLAHSIKPKGIEKMACQGNILFFDARDTGIAPDLLSYGVYEPTETRLVQKIMRPGMTIVNVGANIGYYTLIAARAVGPEGVVHAFEPEPRNFSLLKKNIIANKFTNAQLYTTALGNTRGSLKLFVDAHNLGNPSLSEKNVAPGSPSVEIPTDTLDHVLGDRDVAIDVLQMDVQGAEGLVIQGAVKTIRKNHPAIIMEFWPYGLRNLGSNPKELLDTLTSWGYTIARIDEALDEITPTTPEELITLCETRKNGRGATNIICTHS